MSLLSNVFISCIKYGIHYSYIIYIELLPSWAYFDHSEADLH